MYSSVHGMYEALHRGRCGTDVAALMQHLSQVSENHAAGAWHLVWTGSIQCHMRLTAHAHSSLVR